MQKLVTICVKKSDHSGGVVDHLADYLADSWRIVSVCAASSPDGISSGYMEAVVFIAVVLEKGCA
jgi:hypothetical protein